MQCRMRAVAAGPRVASRSQRQALLQFRRRISSRGAVDASTSGASGDRPKEAASKPDTPSETQQTVFASPLFNVGMGSSYYTRRGSEVAHQSAFDTLPQTAGGSSTSPRAIPVRSRGSPSEVRHIRGGAGAVSIDLSSPPITAEQVANWSVDRHLYVGSQPVFMYPNVREPVFLLPPHATVTSLGTRMDAVDRVYRQKGLFTPSEVAQVLFAVVPSYYVGSSDVFRALPPNVLFRLETLHPRCTWVTVLLARYPMLFKLMRLRFAKSIVKLNSDVWFVRAHPLYKAADRLMRAHNVEYKAKAGGRLSDYVPGGGAEEVSPSADAGDGAARHLSSETYAPIDLRIFRILVRHLPRAPAGNRKAGSLVADAVGGNCAVERAAHSRYTAVPLVEWINSFSAEELATLNEVPQERVVAILNKYVHVFQVLTHALPVSHSTDCIMDAFAYNLFIDRDELINWVGAGDERTETPQSSVDSPSGGAQRNRAADGTPDRPSAPERTCPERLMKEALQDDLVGLDGLASDLLLGLSPAPAGWEADRDPQRCPIAAGTISGKREDHGEDDLGDADENGVCRDSAGRAAALSDRSASRTLTRGTASLGSALHRGSDSGEQADDNEDDSSDGLEPAQRFDVMFVRRLPPDTAPRSLSNFDEHTTPDREMVLRIAEFLNPPPTFARTPSGEVRSGIFRPRRRRDARRSQGGDGEALAASGAALANRFSPVAVDASTLWRWVSVEGIYSALTLDARRHLRRRYRGLVNFLRLHGALFELSSDFRYVIVHDPNGAMAPLVPTQMHFTFEERVVLPESFDEDSSATAALIGDETRDHFDRILGCTQIPTTRQQLVLLDPQNPLLHHIVCEEELAALLRGKGATTVTAFMRGLPPLIRAVLPSNFQLCNNPHVVCWRERGVAMVQHRALGSPPAAACGDTGTPASPLMQAEEAVEALRESVPLGGATVRALGRLHLPDAAFRALEHHFGGVLPAAVAFPHYFRVTSSSSGSRSDSLVELIDR